MGAGTWIGLRLLRRLLDPCDIRVLRLSSIGGLLLLLFGVYGSPSPLALTLLVTLHLLVPITALLGRRGEVPHPDRAAYMAWLFTGGLAFVFVLFDYSESVRTPQSLRIAAITGAGALILHLVIATLGRGRDAATAQRRSERLLWASLPLAFVPLVSVLRDEVYLHLNSREVFSLTPHTLGIVMHAALLVWALLRWWRNRVRTDESGHLNLERLMGGGFFPLLIIAVISLNRYLPVRAPSTNLLEPANAGLMIQQWFEFGRLPFFETFNAHGLADSLFGLIYASLNETTGAAFKHYEFGFLVVNLLLAYWLVRRVTGSPYPALFTVLLLPNVQQVFPQYCTIAIFTIIVLQRVVRRGGYGSWTLLSFYLGLSLIWRLDVGFANIAASFATLAALWLTDESFRPRPLAIIGGMLTAGACYGLAIVSIAAARGLDLAVLTKDFVTITLSNQAFGFTRLAREYNEVVFWHIAVVPACVAVAGLYLVYRHAQRDGSRRPSTFLFTALMFLSAYYFANIPRGLVRHTFVEHANVYIASFSVIVLSSAAYWVWNVQPRAMRFVLFMLIASTLTYHFNLSKPTGKELYTPPMSLTETLPRKISVAGLRPSSKVISRDLFPPLYRKTHLDEMLSFLSTYIEGDETFLDLANSPVLYVFAHKRSPHYANHLMLAHNEYLQGRFLEQLGDYDVPLVLLPVEDEVYEELDVGNPNNVDDVPVPVRQYRLHEYVYEHYEPLAIVNRWQVWNRKGWAPRIPPRGDSYETLFYWHEGQEAGLNGAPAGDSIPSIHLDAEGTYFLQVFGDAAKDGKLQLTWTERTAEGAREVREWIDFQEGKNAFYHVLPYSLGPRSVENLTLTSEDGVFALKTLKAVRGDCPEFAAMAPRLFAARSMHVRRLPYVWGEFDRMRPAEPRVLRPLIDEDDSPTPKELELTLYELDQSPWIRGINPNQSMCLLSDESSKQDIAAGDTFIFAGSGARRVREMSHRRVWVDGKLNPRLDGHPEKVLWRRNYRGLLLREGRSVWLSMEPIEDTSQGSYIRLVLANLSRFNGRVEVDFGQGEERRGQFAFFVEANKDVHEYWIRVSTQYNWHLFENDWIEITSLEVPVAVIEAEVIEGD